MREYRRLLYVAATRAREFLIVCGYEMKNGVHAESWYGHLKEAAARIGREEQIAGETVIAFGASLSGGSAELLALPQPPTRVPKFLTRAAEPEPASRVLRPSEAAGLDEGADLAAGAIPESASGAGSWCMRCWRICPRSRRKNGRPPHSPI